jgi:cell wall-associated NlpC family hydrolase
VGRYLRKLIATILILASLAPVLYITAAAGTIAYGAATVEATSLNVRSGPETTYSIVYTIEQNERIVILEKVNEEWYRIVYRGVEGYVAAMYLKDVLTAENFDAVGKVTGDDVLMRSAPSTSGSILGSTNAGDIVTIIGINSGWYKVKYAGETGYIRSDFIAVIDGTTAAGGTTGGATDAADNYTTTVTKPQGDNLSLRDQLVNYALQYVGYSYVYGGASPSTGFDCSGFVKYIFSQYNYSVTRSASSQYANDGSSIAKSDLLPGDLVFFSSNGGYSVTHVGIYIGNNQFVHASSPKIGVVISSLDSNYYTRVWFGAKRILP